MEERLEVQAEKKSIPGSGKAFCLCSGSSWFCFETVVKLNLDEEYCTWLYIYLIGSLWLVTVLHVTCNNTCSASARVPQYLVCKRSRERWKEKREFGMFSLYLSCLQLFVAKNKALLGDEKC